MKQTQFLKVKLQSKIGVALAADMDIALLNAEKNNKIN